MASKPGVFKILKGIAYNQSAPPMMIGGVFLLCRMIYAAASVNIDKTGQSPSSAASDIADNPSRYRGLTAKAPCRIFDQTAPGGIVLTA